jgi:hypothetical protein
VVDQSVIDHQGVELPGVADVAQRVVVEDNKIANLPPGDRTD